MTAKQIAELKAKNAAKKAAEQGSAEAAAELGKNQELKNNMEKRITLKK